MQSSIIGKIEKANRYSKEPGRVSFTDLRVKFQGEHDVYDTGYTDGKWHCSCLFFNSWKVCSHTMAMQHILSKMLPEEALVTPELPVK
jgi:hypothetical protein